VFNFKPSKRFSISGRFGFASGRLKNKVGDVLEPYPVEVVEIDSGGVTEKRWDDNTKTFVPVNAGETPTIIQKFQRDVWYDANERTSWSLPLDVKFSFFIFNNKGKVLTEIYLGIENLLSLIYTPQGNVSFNEYTGTVDTGGTSASDGLPIPMISFGIKWSY
jgi:hypothetical protein